MNLQGTDSGAQELRGATEPEHLSEATVTSDITDMMLIYLSLHDTAAPFRCRLQ